MGCDQLNLTQRCRVGSIDQRWTFGVFDLGEMLKMYEIFDSQFRPQPLVQRRERLPRLPPPLHRQPRPVRRARVEARRTGRQQRRTGRREARQTRREARGPEASPTPEAKPSPTPKQ